MILLSYFTPMYIYELKFDQNRLIYVTKTIEE